MKHFFQSIKGVIALILAAVLFCGTAATTCTERAYTDTKGTLCAKGGSPYGTNAADDWDISDFI